MLKKKISKTISRNYSRKIAQEILANLEDFLNFTKQEGDLSLFYANENLDWLISSIHSLKLYINWLDGGGLLTNPDDKEKHLNNLKKIFSKSFNKLIKI